jgi:hypothetical protein
MAAAGQWGWDHSTNLGSYTYAGVYFDSSLFPPGSQVVDPSSINNLTQTGATNYWWGINSSGSGSTNFAMYNVSYQTSTRLETLAKMSGASYTPSCGAPIDGYECVKSVQGSNGISLNVYRKGRELVVAIRGTDIGNPNAEAYNLLTDTSFATGTLTHGLNYSVDFTSAVVAALHQENPDASISLTGHSLGGAIAQIVAGNDSLEANTFNAPGVGKVEGKLLDLALYAIPPGASDSTSITNYRLQGDQVSLAGTAGKNVRTVTLANSDYSTPVNFLEYHGIANIAQAIASNASQIDGNGGLSVPDWIYTGLHTVGEHMLGAYWSVDQAIAQVEHDKEYLLDPQAGSRYSLNISAGSPLISQFSLPNFSGFLGWEVNAFDGNAWQKYYMLGTDPLDFPHSVSQVEFFALGAGMVAAYNPNQFAIGLKFDSDGQFNATLNTLMNDGADVPEPASISLFFGGLALIAFGRKMKKF